MEHSFLITLEIGPRTSIQQKNYSILQIITESGGVVMSTSNAKKPTNDRASPIVQSVVTALHLLETLASMQGGTLSNLAHQAGLSLNQVFRFLATFEAAGYVVRDRDKVYYLGAKLHLLGQRAFWPNDLITAAAPQLDSLAKLSGETVLLSIPMGSERMIVDTRPSRHSLRVEYPVGSRLPLYVGGMGVALLAFSPQALIEEVLRESREQFTRYTLVKGDALKAELERTHRYRVRVSHDDYTEGEFSVASPILDTNGLARGALCVAGFTARLNEDARARYVKGVKEAAVKISKALQQI